MSKYQAHKVTIASHTFDSAAEGKRYADLMLQSQAGVIADLAVHPSYELQPGFSYTDESGKKRRVRPIRYEADFAYTDVATGRRVVEDVKGFDRRTGKLIDTPVSALKRKMMLYKHGIVVRIVKAGG